MPVRRSVYPWTMTADPRHVPPRTMRTASIIILGFAAVMLLFGFTMFQTGSSDAKLAEELQATGHTGVVIDARVTIGRNQNRDLRVSHAELTIEGADGTEHIIETNRFPRFFPNIDQPYGWMDEFPTKSQIVGEPVLYSTGTYPKALLVSEIPAIEAAGWSFPNYLGIALLVLGAGAAVGGTVSLVRAVKQLKQ